ncbi:MAG TPA: hypothetical protein VFV07_00810 [Rhizomicrobium sp.]|nr:hypothetical protein [Rhizomicrobium sp.]
MVQIPLERTINETYRFTFRNILSIFGIAWFPGLLAAAAAAAVLWLLWPDIAILFFSALSDKDVAAEAMLRFMARAFTVAGPFFLLFWVLQTMTVVGVQRKALGLIDGPVFIYFTLDGAVWRLILAYIVAFFLFYVGMALVIAVVAGVVVAGETLHLPAIYKLVDAAAIIAAVCAYLYAFVRLTFFLPPVVVAEGGIGVARAWQLGGGNFWRIVALALVCVLAPMIGLAMVRDVVTVPLMMNAIMPLQHAAEEHQIKSLAQFWAMAWPSLKVLVLFMIGFQLVTWPILLGLTNGMSAVAYRNVTPPDPLEAL